MTRSKLNRVLSIILSLALVSAFALPVTAFAESSVKVENHLITTGQKTLSNISIDGVEAPQVGQKLDDTASVSATGDVKWDIPVLWVGDDMQLATQAQQNRKYLPALAFFVPEGYTISGSDFTVSLSDSLTKLFGGEEVVSVYDEATGITYILPASLRNFFMRANAAEKAAEQGLAAGEVQVPQPEEAVEQQQPEQQMSLVEIHCAKTARDAFSDEDLEWLLDLVINKLQPQAVNLLIEKFPAFQAAAAQNQLGREISLYVYYKQGDEDGKPEHEEAGEALAYVVGDSVVRNGKMTYCYMIGIDVNSLVKKDANGNAVRDANGKLTIARTGWDMTTFQNTIVHEMFHAFMDDYNRTGMAGCTNIADAYTPGGKFTSAANKARYEEIRYPGWFTEGSASAVENVYAFRYFRFQVFRAQNPLDAYGDMQSTFTKASVINSYLNASHDGKPLYYGINFSGGGQGIDTDQSRYVSGYLATLYLGELAARQLAGVGTSVSTDGAKTVFSSEKIRLGLNSILQRMHNGETLDAVIKSISTSGTGAGQATLYENVADFESKFIKGVETSPQTYNGDDESCTFVVSFLNYMLDIEKATETRPNGSILFDFDRVFAAPVDPGKTASADFYKIAPDNAFHESTVPNSVALAGGGKSTPTTPATPVVVQSQVAPPATIIDFPTPAAADDEAESSEATGSSELPEASSAEPADATAPVNGEGTESESAEETALPQAAKVESKTAE